MIPVHSERRTSLPLIDPPREEGIIYTADSDASPANKSSANKSVGTWVTLATAGPF